MKITIVGSGYVGLVTGTCFAEVGIEVTCVDIDKKKIENLNQGIIPIFEPGLEEMVHRNIKKGRLKFTTSLAEALEDCEVLFTAVGTPPGKDGSADLQYVINVARECGKNMKDYLLIVTKSTVPVGTAEKVKMALQEELNKRGVDIPFDVASNPEFLKEGAAIDDFPKRNNTTVASHIYLKVFQHFQIHVHWLRHNPIDLCFYVGVYPVLNHNVFCQMWHQTFPN